MTSTNLTVAKTILEQLGGMGMLKMMIGAKDFAADDKSVTFKIGKNAKAVRALRITLEPTDTYSVGIFGNGWKLRKEINDVYVDVLRETLERETGMYLTLGKVR